MQLVISDLHHQRGRDRRLLYVGIARGTWRTAPAVSIHEIAGEHSYGS
jgi:hypothetical protein